MLANVLGPPAPTISERFDLGSDVLLEGSDVGAPSLPPPGSSEEAPDGRLLQKSIALGQFRPGPRGARRLTQHSSHRLPSPQDERTQHLSLAWEGQSDLRNTAIRPEVLPFIDQGDVAWDR